MKKGHEQNVEVLKKYHINDNVAVTEKDTGRITYGHIGVFELNCFRELVLRIRVAVTNDRDNAYLRLHPLNGMHEIETF